MPLNDCPSCGRPMGSGGCARCAAAPDSPHRSPSCAARFIAWTIVLLSLRALFAGGMLVAGSSWGFRFVFGRSLSSVTEAAFCVVAVVGLFALVAEMAVGDRIPVFKPFTATVRSVAVGTAKLAVLVFRLAYLAVEGKPLGGSKGDPKRKKGGNP